jgi:Ni/Co efflux regulator RcnB
MKLRHALVFAIAAILASGQTMADKPAWAGGGQGAKAEDQEEWDEDGERSLQGDDDDIPSRDRVRPAIGSQVHFDARQRRLARDYFEEQFRRGRCPPGLTKKPNGCMPPGRTKKWTIGRPLPREVIYYEMPSTLVLRFGPPPPGYYYVRVTDDILLIALKTGIVIDAIRDLGKS